MCPGKHFAVGPHDARTFRLSFGGLPPIADRNGHRAAGPVISGRAGAVAQCLAFRGGVGARLGGTGHVSG